MKHSDTTDLSTAPSLDSPKEGAIEAAYVHVPFCSHKCEFCDFAAFAGLDHLEDEYFRVLLSEISERVKLLNSPVNLGTIYFGGGTPGLSSVENIRSVLEHIESLVDVSPDAEISLETTPHAITKEKLEGWRTAGVNRLSIGIESLLDEELVAIGRDHSRTQAEEGLQLACQSGIDNISIDLMYGLPTQTIESWQKTLERLLALIDLYPQIKHVSSYGLQLAENSPLYSRFPKLSTSYPDEDVFCRMFQLLIDRLATREFEQYEVSNFARIGYRCRHNSVYWKNEQYLAFGVGAHRYVEGWRSSNWRSLKKYMREPLSCEMEEFIDPDLRLKEGIMLGLRMREGIELEQFATRYGVDLERQYARQISRLKEAGYVELAGGYLRLTESGLPVSNSVLVEFM